MKKDDKEKWIEQLHKQLDDYSEDVPEFVWDKLDRELNHKVVPLWRRWQSIAAVMLLAVASSIMVYMFVMYTPSDKMQIEQMNLASDTNIDNIKNESLPLAKEGSITDVSDVKSNLIADNNKAYRKSNDKKSDIFYQVKQVADESNDDIVSDNNDIIIKESNKEKSEQKELSDKPATNNKPRVRQKYTYSAPSHTTNRKWSVGVNSGGLGVNSTSNIAGAMMRFNSVDKPQQGEVMDSPNMYGGNLLADNYFANIISLSTIKTKKKHYQPVTFGLSLKFEVDRDWSIETGLTYTYLFSKLESGSLDNVVKQEQRLKYIGVPLKMSRNIYSTNSINLYGTAGAEIEKCISGKQETFTTGISGEEVRSEENVDINQLQLSLSASVGAEYKMSRRLGIYAEPGVVYYFDDKSGIETIRSEHPLNFNLKVGLRFTFSK